MSEFVVGVDLGGTNVRAAAYSASGEAMSERFEIPSRAQQGTDAIFDALAEVVAKVISDAKGEPKGIGLAIPGHVDDEAGVVVWAPNLGKQVNGVFQYWEHVQVRTPIKTRTGLPLWMGNDANLAALGEYRYGHGKNAAKCLVLLTVGTGIGGGVILRPASVQGKAEGPLLLVGGNKGGAELGHIMIQHGGLDCNAGTYGSLEAYCQRDAIVRRAVHRLKRGRESLLVGMVEKDWSKVTPYLISEAANRGDELATEVWNEVGTALGVGIGSLINVFAPDVFVIGGQIANAGELLLGPARNTARNVAIASLYKDCKIMKAEQIEDAGILGGAALAANSLGWE